MCVLLFAGALEELFRGPSGEHLLQNAAVVGMRKPFDISDVAGAQQHGVMLSAARSARTQPDMPALAALAASAELAITIGATYPLAQAAAAQTTADTGHARGKVVLLV